MKGLIFFLVLFIFSCQSDQANRKKIPVNESFIFNPERQETEKIPFDSLNYIYKKFKTVAKTYKPTQINLSKDMDSLFKPGDEKYIKAIFSNERFNRDSLQLWNTIILLKLFLYHLENAHQGYDLYRMRKGVSKEIINYYLIDNNFDTIGEFFESGIPYEIEKRKNIPHKEIKVLIERIDSLDKAIQKQFKEILKENN